MAAPTLEGRLICASNWAYMTSATGPLSANSPYDAGSALQGTVDSFASGLRGRDAAIVGSGPDGVVLAFRGTLPPTTPDHRKTLDDWLQDLEAALVAGDRLPGLAHQGFLGALDALWDDVAQAVLDRLTSSPVKHLHITGHSKGGALAHLAAARFAIGAQVHGSDITVRTFEGAHPGDGDFADGYQRLVPDSIRFEYQDDLVPHLPPSILFRKLFKDEPFFRTLMAVDDRVDFAPAGRLQFIDWTGKVQDKSTLLQTQRLFHLSQRVVALDFKTIVDDHSISCGSGCMSALCPTGVC